MSLERADKPRTFSNKLFRRSTTAELPPSNDFGLETFYAPAVPTLDIVFVHGLTGHRRNTWAAGGSGTAPWPQSLLPSKIPDARILSFGYDANVIGRRSKLSGNRIGDHAKHLLASLAIQREADNTNDIPIIFVCHSLGGIVCEDALASSKSSAESHLAKILECTHGILFLGTPHSGSILACLSQLVAQAVSPGVGTNISTLEVLRRDSEVLARIKDGFHSMLRSQSLQGHRLLSITCFYEELATAGIGEVVPKHSAILPGYPALGIHSDHRGLARFATEDDPGFKIVVGELQRVANAARTATLAPGPSDELARDDLPERAGPTRDIIVYGDFINSNLVNGSQTVMGGLVFS
ncbi:hypothetical protein GQ53DRAFT_842009 [Thozetella sp. PMI_491]|nr:hypothetical protein GQ53DRAFT_842009 [Thozetella sp. PMI_491]